jgi:hypothetical protein
MSLVSGGVNLLAIAAMGLVLAPATPAGGGLAARVAYLADHRALVATGWFCWMAASLCLLAHFASLRQLLASPAIATFRGDVSMAADFLVDFALVVASVGAALDIGADLLMMTVLPTLAAEIVATPAEFALAALFRSWDQAAVGLTGGVANTLYAIAGGLFTVALYRVACPRALVSLGAVTWGVAALATLALAFAPATLPAAVAFSIFLYVAWAWAIGAWCLWGYAFEASEAGGGKARRVRPWFGP